MNWPIKPKTEKTTTQTPITQPITTSQRTRPLKRNENNLISLSEILQGIGISLPQFLIQLKTHNSDLKEFTAKLEKRELTKVEFKRAHGNVGELLNILDESSTSERSSDLNMSTTLAPTKITTNSESTVRKYNSKQTTPPVPTTSQKVEASSNHETGASKNLNQEEITSSPTSTTSTPRPTKKPKTFGFKPSVSIKNTGIDAISPNISVAKDIDSKSNENENLSQRKEFTTEKSAKPKPYKPGRGGWRERMQHNRGMVGSRLGSTTKRPKVRPNYGYYGGESRFPLFESKEDEDSLENESETTERGSVRDPHQRISSIIGLTEGTPLGGNYNHPRYDKDPNSLNIATRSAIMAAGILGGIALAVFLTILIFVMYKNHSGKQRLRIPLPLSVSGDDSTSSTPPLYVKRPRYAVTTRSSKNTDFWGTLRKKFDPYSLSSSSASYY